MRKNAYDFHGHARLQSWYHPPSVNWKIQQPSAIPSNRIIINFKQLRQCLHLCIFISMVEPTWPDSHIYHTWILIRVPLSSYTQHFRIRRSRGIFMSIKRTPVCLPNRTMFVSTPTNVRTTFIPDNRIRLQLAY